MQPRKIDLKKRIPLLNKFCLGRCVAAERLSSGGAGDDTQAAPDKAS